jgi:hypothetical protein
VFLLAAAALVAVGIASFVALRMPPEPAVLRANEPLEISQATPLVEVYAEYQRLQNGIRIDPPRLSKQDRAIVDQRSLMKWGIRIALAVAGCIALAAAAVLLSGKAGKR